MHIVRGRNIANFETEYFEIDEDGTYFVAFYAGSYDRNGSGGDIGAFVEVREVRVPSGTVMT